MSNSKPVLGYWKLRGYGHPIRFLLAYMGVDYEDKMYSEAVDSVPKWAEDKTALDLDFPNLPYWKDETAHITESKAILKYLARKYDPTLCPSDFNIMWKLEMLEGVITDIWNLLIMISYYYSDTHQANLDANLSGRLEKLSKFIGLNKFFLGDKPYYVDFVIYECLYHYTQYKAGILKPFPNLETFLKNFEGIPAISKFMNSANFLKAPLQGASSRLKL